MQSTAIYTTTRRREERGGLNGGKEEQRNTRLVREKRERKQVIKHMINYSSALE